MKNVRIAIVGSGGMAKRRAETFRSTPGCELVALAARNPETGPALASAYELDLTDDWQTLLKRRDVDALVVCTHNELHGRIALSALEAGKHVFTEYPVARFFEEIARLEARIENAPAVLRVAHGEAVSAAHRALKARVAGLGDLLVALFTRLTPGRGARPEVLFNLALSGPPALFFVYHIYELVDLFGPPAWVECGASYVGLQESGRYDRFANAVTVGFERGGLGQWNWAGGIEIRQAEETQRIVLTGGTLLWADGQWQCSTPSGVEPLPVPESDAPSLEAQFLQDIANGTSAWQADARCALHAARVGLAAEQSAKENRRVLLSDPA